MSGSNVSLQNSYEIKIVFFAAGLGCSVVDGVLTAGHFRGAFQDNRIFSLRKRFNRIEFVSENTSFYFNETNALKRAARANISPSVLVSQEIVAEDAAKSEFLIKPIPFFSLKEGLLRVSL